MRIGKVSFNVLNRSVLRQVNIRRKEVENGAGIGGDCAVFAFPDGDLTVTCVQEAALTVQKPAPRGAGGESEGSIAGPQSADGESEGRAAGLQGAFSESEGSIAGPQSAGSESEGSIAGPQSADGESEGRAAGSQGVHAMWERQGMDSGQVTQARTGEGRPAEQRTMAQLLQKCANNLAAKGAEPVAALITLLLPEGLEEPDLKALMKEADQACRDLQMQIAGGQTRTTAAVAVPYGVVTGMGKIPAQAYRSLKAAAPGQDVVVSKWVGLEGTAYLAKQYGEKLLGRYPAWLVEEASGFDRFLSVIPEAATAMKSGVCAMHDVSEGGIFGALWELAEGAGVGLTIDLKKLPLRQETVEVCEFCNANPYELLSGGCLLMTSEDGPKLAAALKAEGIPAAVVGKVTDSNDRILINEDEIRYLDRPKEDQIYRIGAVSDRDIYSQQPLS